LSLSVVLLVLVSEAYGTMLSSSCRSSSSRFRSARVVMGIRPRLRLRGLLFSIHFFNLRVGVSGAAADAVALAAAVAATLAVLLALYFTFERVDDGLGEARGTGNGGSIGDCCLYFDRLTRS